MSGGTQNKIDHKVEYVPFAIPCSRVTNRPGYRRASTGMFMYFRWKSLAVLATSIAVPAVAQPVYLACSMTQPDGSVFQTNVQMNEDAGTVSYAFPDQGRAYTVKAIFTPTEVAFNAFTVSRTDLTFVRANTGDLARIGGMPPYSYGKCAVDKTPRAF
ncbi:MULTISPECIES: hypothetical protein [unclassified Sphingomonas]|uniref:hypothetical protein n=1 Tax=Sphingomonas sp. PvP015 TaxID=3156388 RepID=UPI003396AD68